ncbi:MAG: hypothetical protein AB7V40_10655 [Methyloceanibacter sp.]
MTRNRLRHVFLAASRLSAVTLLLGLAGCADMAVKDSPPPSAQLQRQYDKTLTKAEQQAVISDLQKASTTKDEETGAVNDPATEEDNTN